MVKAKEQMTVDNKLCLQISTGTDAYDVDKLLEFAPEQTEHCYYELYVQLHDLAEFYIKDYKAQDNIKNWYKIFYDFIMFHSDKVFKDSHLDSEYQSLVMFNDIIDDSIDNIKEKHMVDFVENEEKLYIKCIVNIFEKHDNIAESFVKYLCGRYSDSLRLIEKGKVY